MTDLSALLKQSIIDRGISEPSARANIYAEARRAVIRRLWEHDPPIAMDDIDARIMDFDSAVSLVEEDLLAYFEAAVGNARGARRLPPPRAYARTPEPAGAGDPYDDHALEPPDYDQQEAGYQDGYEEPANLPVQYSYNETAYDPEGYDSGYDDPAFDDGTYTYTDADYDAPGGTYEEPLGYDDPDGDYAAPGPADRWSTPREGAVGPREAEPATPRRKRTPRVSEGVKVALLASAIVSLVAALGILGYVLVSSGSGGDEGVTVAINERRQVSDAATAFRIAADDAPVTQTYVVFDGQDPTVFETPATNPVRFDRDNEGSFARVSSNSSASGARVVIGPGLAASLAGQNVRVRVIARSSRELGAASMRFAYQSGVAISHWQTANLDPGYAELGIQWRVPSQRTSVHGDYLVVEPGIPGDGTGVDIRAVEVDVLAPQ